MASKSGGGVARPKSPSMPRPKSPTAGTTSNATLLSSWFAAADTGDCVKLEKYWKLLNSRNRIDIDITDDKGRTALYLSCQKGFLPGCQWLVNHGALVSRAPQMLFACIVRGQTSALEYLIINGDTPLNIVDAKHRSLIEAAMSAKQTEAVYALMDKNADAHPMAPGDPRIAERRRHHPPGLPVPSLIQLASELTDNWITLKRLVTQYGWSVNSFIEIEDKTPVCTKIGRGLTLEEKKRMNTKTLHLAHFAINMMDDDKIKWICKNGFDPSAVAGVAFIIWNYCIQHKKTTLANWIYRHCTCMPLKELECRPSLLLSAIDHDNHQWYYWLQSIGYDFFSEGNFRQTGHPIEGSRGSIALAYAIASCRPVQVEQLARLSIWPDLSHYLWAAKTLDVRINPTSRQWLPCIDALKRGRREVRRQWGQSLSIYLYGDVMRIVLEMLDGSMNLIISPGDTTEESYDIARDTIEGVPNVRREYGYWRCIKLDPQTADDIDADNFGDDDIYNLAGIF